MRRPTVLTAALVVALACPSAAGAAQINVTTQADELDDGSSGSGCSLREAVQSANTNVAVGGCMTAGQAMSPDLISLPAGAYQLSRAGADEQGNDTGDLDVSTAGGALTIAGNSAAQAVIDGLLLDRALDITGNGAFGLSDVTVRLGQADGTDPEDVGAGIRWEAGTGPLTVTGSVFEGNIAGQAAALAIASTGAHSIADSRFSGNIAADLGAIHSSGSLTVTRTAITGNNGGGIKLEDVGSGSLTVTDSTIANSGLGADTGIGAIDAEGDVTVTNSTIHNNVSGFVGGITAPGHDIEVHFSTITDNVAPDTSAGHATGGIDVEQAQSVTLDGVILAGNATSAGAANCNDVTLTPVTPGPHPNLESADTCDLSPPSLVNTDPQLDPLADNGGPTPTRGLYPGSPALDKAPGCSLPTDQRGTPRDGSCDLGAFEGTVPRPVVTPPVNPLPPNTSKRCKAKIRRCCTKKQKARGRPKYCRKKKRRGREAGTAAAREVIGRSVQGRPLVATRIGDPDGERVALVVGVIHGDERAGLRVVSQLKRRWSGVKGLQLWVMKTLNPDGQRTRSRKNARGVDLNRNFPAGWRGGAPESSGYYPGPSPASEPETKAAMAFIERIQPDVSVWYHQPWGAVLACKGRPAIAARYAKLAGMKTSCRGRGLPGTAIGWQRDELEGSDAFVVEFGPGGLSDRAARRHARAAAIIGRDG